jgi:hypothetical protein
LNFQRRLFKRRSSGATEDGNSQNGSAGQRRRLAPNSAEMVIKSTNELLQPKIRH